MGIAVFKETTGGGYNIGIGYNPFTENIQEQIILVLDTGHGTVWGVIIHRGQKQISRDIQSTAIGTGATITASNQMVLGTSGSSLLLYHQRTLRL
jgi:hypothetical protein